MMHAQELELMFVRGRESIASFSSLRRTDVNFALACNRERCSKGNIEISSLWYDSTMIDGQTGNVVHTPVRAQTQQCGETDDPTSI
jgi:hypothetical protein